jgi:2-polyprenyl-6-methoxyphenol hydroxylase-like FAD-dependent oxidoreductase
MTHYGDHALVLGASMGGLLAARVLADHYRRVTVVERDALPADPVGRRGVPQGRQPHVLLARSSIVLEDLFPGFLDELVEAGAHTIDGSDMSRYWIVFGGHKIVGDGPLPGPAKLQNYFASRPFLEWHVCRRLRALPNVTICEQHDVVGLTATADGERVTGARVAPHGVAGATEQLAADLVVDATGRGSRTPAFLEQLGYGRPTEDELAINVTYASFPARLPVDAVPERMIGVFPEPQRPTGFLFVRCEDDTCQIGIGALAGRQVPTDRAALLDFAAPFAPPHALAAARRAEPLGEVSQYRVPSNRWRRYDRMPRTPKGLVVFGDAICSFNPIYGQGMTVAAIEATLLRECLAGGTGDLPRRFYRAAARQLRVAWQTAVGSDLTFPQIEGPRPLSTRVTNAFLDRVLTAAETDPVVAEQFLMVTGMVEDPIRLMRPSILARVAHATRRRRPPAPADASARYAPAATP